MDEGTGLRYQEGKEGGMEGWRGRAQCHVLFSTCGACMGLAGLRLPVDAVPPPLSGRLATPTFAGPLVTCDLT